MRRGGRGSVAAWPAASHCASCSSSCCLSMAANISSSASSRASISFTCSSSGTSVSTCTATTVRCRAEAAHDSAEGAQGTSIAQQSKANSLPTQATTTSPVGRAAAPVNHHHHKGPHQRSHCQNLAVAAVARGCGVPPLCQEFPRPSRTAPHQSPSSAECNARTDVGTRETTERAKSPAFMSIFVLARDRMRSSSGVAVTSRNTCTCATRHTDAHKLCYLNYLRRYSALTRCAQSRNT